MIIPWQVDVPQDKRPVANWLVVLACFIVAFIQVEQFAEHKSVTITDTLLLQGWELKGLLGYMWLHGGLLHLLGNMWFLWIFGNAVCANIGNLRYLPVYVALGVAAGMTHLLASLHPALGASGAINGIVGMYLVMFPQNEITCYFWFFLVYARRFSVSSYWMILFWLFWDILGALKWGSSGVAHFAHLGGFGAGVGMGLLFCKMGWCLLDKYDRSLLQIWQDRRRPKEDLSFPSASVLLGAACGLGSPGDVLTPQQTTFPTLDLARGTLAEPPPAEPICACGERVVVSAQYAGKTVQCLRCGAPVQIPADWVPRPAVRPKRVTRAGPASTPQREVIRFACSCGQKIKVPARLAGRTGKCPRCGTRLKIPSGQEKSSRE